MSDKSPYIILGVKPGAEQAAIKKAYRKLAKQYHPDKNNTPGAANKFLEVKTAYEELSKGKPSIPYKREESYSQADSILKKEREKARAQARKREAQRKESEEKFKKSQLYDLLLLFKYFFNALLLLFSFAAFLGPIILGIVIEPVVFFATIFFVIIGVFLLWYIYDRRKTWFKLGKFNTSWDSLIASVKKPIPHPTKDYCSYLAGSKADGKPYNIKLIMIFDIQVKSFGAMDHQAKFKKKASNLIIPRSVKAEFIHRICSFSKITILIVSLFFFPVSSLFWRLIAGIIFAGFVSLIILKINKVKGKSSFLFTPSLTIKVSIWLIAVFALSKLGPGFEISLNDYKYLLFGGLFFLTDMLFDLVFGFFPFYRKLFRPFFKQGKVLSKLYDEGYQNNEEYPFYSMLFPFFKWIF